MVLVDTPPMLQITDARVVGRIMDAVILVARAEQTTRDALIATSKRLAEDRLPVLGIILNGWNPKWSSASYAYYKAGYGIVTPREAEPATKLTSQTKARDSSMATDS